MDKKELMCPELCDKCFWVVRYYDKAVKKCDMPTCRHKKIPTGEKCKYFNEVK